MTTLLQSQPDRRASVIISLLLAACFCHLPELRSATSSEKKAPEKPPRTPKEFYNAGTKKLREGRLNEAEAYFESALAAQVEAVQPPALYNLGDVRFLQGVEELKKSPPSGEATEREKNAIDQTGSAIEQADQALASGEVQKMVTAYMRGRGTRREIKAATEAVKQALAAAGKTLNKWQRSLNDFKSSYELNPNDPDATFNAGEVERAIARLVDSLQKMKQMAMAAGQKEEKLKEKLKQLKGKIPGDKMPPGAAGDDEEEDEKPAPFQEGQKEGPTKDGKEMDLSPEQAGWLLQGFKLDSDRKMPMSFGEEAKPRDRNRPTW
jgi:tetratricopeptide (TPR) repeat protein